MVDLLDRILDKGIVIDVWARVALAGIDFGMRWDARMVVASIDTHFNHAGPIDLLDKLLDLAAKRIARRNLALKMRNKLARR